VPTLQSVNLGIFGNYFSSMVHGATSGLARSFSTHFTRTLLCI